MGDIQPYLNYLEIGELYQKVGDFEKAKEAYEKVIECSELASFAWVNIAKIEAARNHLKTAKEYYLRAVETDTESYEIL